MRLAGHSALKLSARVAHSAPALHNHPGLQPGQQPAKGSSPDTGRLDCRLANPKSAPVQRKQQPSPRRRKL